MDIGVMRDMLDVDRYELLTLGVDFIAFAVMMALGGRMVGGMARVRTFNELTERDNVAFGIAFAAAIFSVAIMMSGAVSGSPSITLVHEAGIVFAYGALGIILLGATRVLFDRVALPHIDLQAQVLAGNAAAGIVDAANMVSTAVVIRAVMIWVDNESFAGLLVVLIGFLFSQLVMFAVTYYRQWVYRRRHQGAALQAALERGNLALALRYCGHRIGAALAITAASGIAVYADGEPLLSAFIWSLVSLVMVVVVSLLAIAARHLILIRVDIAEEVGRQRNVAVGLSEGLIYIALGLIMAALFGAGID